MVDHFIQAGHEVVMVDNLVAEFQKNISSATKWIDVDICSKELAGVILQSKPDVVNRFAMCPHRDWPVIEERSTNGLEREELRTTKTTRKCAHERQMP